MRTRGRLARWAELRNAEGPVDPCELESLWSDLDTVRAADILGDWRGFAFSTGHPVEKLLGRSGWYGKSFVWFDDAKPLICRAADGSLYSDTRTGNGEASLWDVEFRGEVTASMVYDGMPVVDHFKRVDDSTLMGVMNGKSELVLSQGQHFWFGLERV
ncbi:MAG: DUF4334 domain-containing protein [Nocardioides sp.]|uniref:DUF4334 domain-containing protein n=1 Tax=Nocardioides sp. TaxID=35761 RepID=UPI003F02DF7E